MFGNKQYPGTIMPTIRLHKPGATQEKFIDEIVATLANKPELFVIPKAVKAFDFSWRHTCFNLLLQVQMKLSL